MRKIIFLLLILICFSKVNLQSQDSTASIFVIHKVEKDRIILRWAPSSAGAWHSSMKYGYKIERIANRSSSNEMNENIIIKDQLLPWSKDRWTKEKVDTYDKYCIIVAELMYGKKSDAANNGKLLQKADDFNNRYTYAMMSADFSPQAADALGLRYEDKDVKPGHTYIYKITSLTPPELYPIEQAGVIAFSSEIDTMIAPTIHHIESGDLLVHLFWTKEQDFTSKYTAFFIEKTEDGKTFVKLNEDPYISSNQFGEQFNQYYIYSDSIPQNYKNYGYRLIGISPFGERSPISEIVYAAGRDLTPPKEATKLISTQQADGKMQIDWAYDKFEEKELRGFLIGRSVNVLDSFENITPVILPPETRVFVDENPNQLRANFYFVTAIDTAGNYAISQSHYAHIIDSIAPSAPKNIRGEAFKDGTILLSWDNNKEADILGYTVHYSNQPDHVYAAVTNKPVLLNRFQDTVMIRTMSEHLYYKVVAIDRSYNHSPFSVVLKVTIPDLVPPAVALINNFETSDSSITVNWINSTSDDVVKHVLFRKTTIEAEWEKIFETKKLEERKYEDKSVAPNITYYYKVHAIDDSNMQSVESTIIKVIASLPKQDTKELNLKVKMENNKALLTWNAMPDVKYYTLYKTNDKGQFITMTTTKKEKYTDTPENMNIKYALRITNQNGITNDFTDSVAITQK